MSNLRTQFKLHKGPPLKSLGTPYILWCLVKQALFCYGLEIDYYNTMIQIAFIFRTWRENSFSGQPLLCLQDQLRLLLAPDI